MHAMFAAIVNPSTGDLVMVVGVVVPLIIWGANVGSRLDENQKAITTQAATVEKQSATLEKIGLDVTAIAKQQAVLQTVIDERLPTKNK